MLAKGFDSVLRTGGRKTTRRRSKWRNISAIETDREDEQIGQKLSHYIFSAMWTNNFFTLYSTSSVECILLSSQIKAKIIFVGVSFAFRASSKMCLWCRYASLTCRFTWLRLTACLKRFLGTLMRMDALKAKETTPTKMILAFIWLDNKIHSTEEVEYKVKKLLVHIAENI